MLLQVDTKNNDREARLFLDRNMSLFVCLLQEKYYGREIILADRDMVEQSSGLYHYQITVFEKYQILAYCSKNVLDSL